MRDADLVAVQPRVSETDYAGEGAFGAMVERLVRLVEARIGPPPRPRPALVVFPEMFGAFLGLAGHPEAISARTTDGAMTRVAARMPGAVLREMLRHRAGPKRALLLALGPEIERRWRDAFAPAARRLGAWVVAGSALVPEGPGGQVRNVSLLFDPGGGIAARTSKCNLVPTLEDVLSLSPGAPGDVRAVDLGGLRAATLICYDGFRIAHTDAEPGFVPLGKSLDRLGVDVIAHPSANAWPWNGPWVFNDPGEHQIRRDQWRTEGIASQLAGLARVRWAVTAHLTGRVLDNAFEGRSQILRRDGSTVIVAAEARSIDQEEVVHVRTGG